MYGGKEVEEAMTSFQGTSNYYSRGGECMYTDSLQSLASKSGVWGKPYPREEFPVQYLPSQSRRLADM